MRLLAPVLVALAELSFKRFMAYSAVSLSAFTAVYIFIGVIFHDNIYRLVSKIPKVDNIIFIIAMALVMIVVTILLIKKFKS